MIDKVSQKCCPITLSYLDPLVLTADKSRVTEVRAATLQEVAQVAARSENWAKVDQTMLALAELGEENEWIKASVQRLKAYSTRRQRESFSKETLYKSRKMKQRSVAKNEEIFSSRSESGRPSYLRRKMEQGKREL